MQTSMSPRAAAALLAIAMLSTTTGALTVRAVAADGTGAVEAVIKLLEGLKTSVVAEGETEATMYAKFSTFCKTSSEDTASSVDSTKDDIDAAAAELKKESTDRDAKKEEVLARLAAVEDSTKKAAEEKTRCAAEALDFEAVLSDIAKSIYAVQNAITTIESSHATIATNQALVKTVAVVRRVNFTEGKGQKALARLVQLSSETKETPPGEYEVKSGGILETLATLETSFTTRQTEQKAEELKCANLCTSRAAAYTLTIGNHNDEIEARNTEIAEHTRKIGLAEAELVKGKAQLVADEAMMGTLTTTCQERAEQWDQRTVARKEELEAIEGALTILTGDATAHWTTVSGGAVASSEIQAHAHSAALATKKAEFSKKAADKAPALFLQLSKGNVTKAKTNATGVSTPEDRKAKAIAMLHQMGQKLSSTVLAAAEAQLRENPFKEVKALIHELITRLLAEAGEESTRKGWCDTNTGREEGTRKARQEDIDRLTLELEGLKAQMTLLTSDISDLGTETSDAQTELSEAEGLRVAEESENAAQIGAAKEGIAAVTKAIALLKTYYAKHSIGAEKPKGARGEGDLDAGFGGTYHGSRDLGSGVISALEVLKGKFQQALGDNTKSEAEARENYADLARDSSANIAAGEKESELKSEDLAALTDRHAVMETNLQSATELRDAAVEALTALEAQCSTISTYEERKAKREEEIAALKKALCVLDTEGKEADC